MDVPNNRSEYVEYCVEACTATYWIAFQEYSITVNDDYRTPKTAAVFVWVPYESANNTVVATYCTFEHKCEGKGFRFRLNVNDVETSAIRVQGSSTWSASQVYTDWSFTQGIEIVPNQDLYKIQIRFEPEEASDRVCVRNICMFLEVLDGLPALGP